MAGDSPWEERDAAHLWDIVHAAQRIDLVVAGRREDDLLHDGDLQWIIERGLTVVGTAARRLSDAARTRLPGVPWRDIIALRNKIVHEYDELDYERMWRVVTIDLPALVDVLRSQLPAPPSP